MRQTGISMDRVERAIVRDIDRQVSNGARIPTSSPARNQIIIDGVKIEYRAIYANGRINIGNYYPL